MKRSSLESPDYATPSDASSPGGSGKPRRKHRLMEEEYVNQFVAHFRNARGRQREDQSFSIAVAHKAASVMHDLVECVREREQASDSPSKLALQHGEGAVKVATEQVVKLIQSITRVGKGIQTTSMFRLLLGNVTHRVLSIVREAAAAAATTPQVLEAEARIWLNSLPTGRPDDVSSQEPDNGSEDDPGGSGSHQAPMPRESTEEPSEGSESDFADNSSMPKADSDPYADVELSGDERNASTKAAVKQAKQPRKSKQFSGPSKGLGRLGKSVAFPDEEATGGMHSGALASSSVRIAARCTNTTSSNAGMPGEGSSSLSSDYLSTPPRQHVVLQRASSVVGEQDLPEQRASFPVRFDDFVDRALLGIKEFEDMLEDITTHLCENAAKHLNEKDIIVTLGVSHSTKHFLLRAADDLGGKTFKVVLLDTSGSSSSRGEAEKFAATLRERGVEVSVLPDSSAFAVMAICSKVLIGCENVLANGGLLARMGTHALCIAARHFSVPVLVITMTLKMTPHYPSDGNCTSLVKISRHRAEEHQAGIWEVFGSPFDNLPLDHVHHVDVNSVTCAGELDIPSGLIEYVPADLVSLFATNDGEYTVAQIHRIVRDNYNVED